MLLNMPLAIWFGLFTIISLFTTFSFGIALHFFKKRVFKYHMTFAFITVSLAVIHAILVVYWMYFGIVL